MSVNLKRLLLFVILKMVNSESDDCVVAYRNGFINGVTDYTPNGRAFCAYLGIPYAEPPLGNLRFEPPVPYNIPMTTSYTTPFSKMGPECIQKHNILNGSEDCLYLNVFTPQIKQNELSSTSTRQKMPVFFWIHGGSYFIGSASSDHNGPQPIVEKDVIVVTINYRLGILGFLSITEVNITGNIGLRDQQLALKWTKENIKYFGGDSDAITIVGWSAGSAATSFHLHAEGSAGLFDKAIMMSGSMLNPWAYFDHPEFCVEQLLTVLKSQNTSVDFSAFERIEPDHRKSFLQSLSIDDIFRNLTNVAYRDFGFHYSCFVPTRESNPYYPPIISTTPADLKNTAIVNNVPLLIGFTNIEDESNVFYSLTHNLSYPNRPKKDFPGVDPSQFAKLIQYIENEFHDLEHRHKYEKLFNSSLQANPDFFNLLLSRLSTYGDLEYGVRNYLQAYNNQSTSDIFMYRFSYGGKFSCLLYDYKEYFKGAAHGDDLGYLFRTACHDVDFIRNNKTVFQDELKMQDMIVGMWTNFVKYGNPTPMPLYNTITPQNITWQPYQTKGEFLNIDTKMEMRPDQTDEIKELWHKIEMCEKRHECDFLSSIPNN